MSDTWEVLTTPVIPLILHCAANFKHSLKKQTIYELLVQCLLFYKQYIIDQFVGYDFQQGIGLLFNKLIPEYSRPTYIII